MLFQTEYICLIQPLLAVGPCKVHCLSDAGTRVTITILTSGLKIYLFVKMDLF